MNAEWMNEWMVIHFSSKGTILWNSGLLSCVKLVTHVCMALYKCSYMNMSLANFCFKILLKFNWSDKINAEFCACHYFQHSLILEEKETSFPHLPQPEESFLFENKIPFVSRFSFNYSNFHMFLNYSHKKKNQHFHFWYIG